VPDPESIPPLCPSCSQQMEFERAVERDYVHDIVTYRCSRCSVWFTVRTPQASETSQTVKDNLRRVHAKKARKVVSRKLALYHRSLIEHLSKDSQSLFDHVMEQARRNAKAKY
jgi:iron-sulfur cluster repair protein YtfE (RIC family)